ncbi:MAG: 3',5'-cyclic-nucleotide phosphodiesterase [Thiotrichales bacterium]|jgi:ribonuclease BN (tRNA processing enzyme)|nr:3',5'-cyclic-nucleotide phosphodiesterase [Thiotrichales bacterium]MBT3613377.1 3',5'-cyclic-nucleotide phosphodiesterase [Thiotrichales bacterium]MBT4971950.1 3',5'-cyclic-nucleotide phosphodiesterase [Thiotrichales bacterium]MBT6173050.1 3',5'-cyclic-nucleotide phosphodiesterase [Thiotrichales bacterium]MBT6617784.1 3',5'-cyclic-nucleotide phosphodiesterase [Thiotrichales bacterium]
MEVEILGCSGGIGVGLRTTSILINSNLLIDAGTGVGDLPLTRMKQIRHLFLTHTHLDHIISLPFMADNMITTPGEYLNIYALPESIAILKKHIMNWDIWPDFTKIPTPENPVLRLHEVSPGTMIEMDGVSIEMVPVNHVVPTVGYYLKNIEGSGSFLFSGDTTTNESLWDFLNSRPPVDELIVECSFMNKDRELSLLAKHYNPELLAEDLKKLNYKPNVRISHLKPGIENELMDQCKRALPNMDVYKLERGDIFEI